MFDADANNGVKFDAATGKLLFALLYHESFHAYVATFVYPPLKPDDVKAGKGTGELPRWLNEGLAQVFETAVVEAGELRADHPDKDRLQRAKDWLKLKNGNSLVPLGDLLATGRDAFLASHADQKAASDRAYLTCWGAGPLPDVRPPADRHEGVRQVPDRGQQRWRPEAGVRNAGGPRTARVREGLAHLPDAPATQRHAV